jgi:hypothetical protein
MFLVALLIAQDAPNLAAAIARTREQTRAETPCRQAAGEEEVVICARRAADRYRLPLVTHSAGKEAAEVRVARLLDTAPPPCGEGAFLVKCGAVGVSASISARGVRTALRPLAP